MPVAINALEVFNDVTNGELVVGLSDSTQFAGLAGATQGDQLYIEYTPVKPIGSVAPFYAPLDITPLTLGIYIGPRAGAEALLAANEAWTPQVGPDANGKSQYFFGVVDLNTVPMNAAIGNNDSISTWLEIRLSESGNTRVVYEAPFIVAAAVRKPAGLALPLPATSYLTRDECIALFVQFVNNAPGKTLEFTSPDGTAKRILGVNNDKSALDDLV